MAFRSLAKGVCVSLCVSVFTIFSAEIKRHISSPKLNCLLLRSAHLPRHLILFFCLQHTNETKLGLIRHYSHVQIH